MSITHPSLLGRLLLIFLSVSLCQSFVPSLTQKSDHRELKSSIEIEPLPLLDSDLEELKTDLVQLCKTTPKPAFNQVCSLVDEIESLGELVRHL